MTQDRLSLGAEFPTPSLDDWTRLVEKSLGGAPFDKKMRTKTDEGFSLSPLYTAADETTRPVDEGLPGFSPFVRGATPQGAAQAGWDICQDIDHPDPKGANAQILADLERGATSVTLSFDWITRCGLDETCLNEDEALDSGGIFIQTLDDLETVLDGVFLDLAPVRLNAGNAFEAASLALCALWEKRGIAPEKAVGAFNADPIGEFAHGDPGVKAPDLCLARLGKLAVYTAQHWPRVTTVLVNGAVYHNAGSSESQMLGAMLATGVAYLRTLETAGLDLAAAARQIVFNVPMDADQFMGIAKLRALRRTWDRVLDACGVPPQDRTLTVTATTADRMLTVRDPWVNLLRTTVSTFAAVVGGAQSITVAPFDTAIGLSTDFSRRIARNIQIVLMEESNLGRVIDPAGGAWYVETLTDQLAESAWAEFSAIEGRGGIVAALLDGSLETAIGDVSQCRQTNIANRRIPLTGVNEFPNLAEAPVETQDVNWDALETQALNRAMDARAKTAALLDTLDGDTSTLADVLAAVKAGAPLGGISMALNPRDNADVRTGLWGCALAEDFEDLRDRADIWKDLYGTYPRIFLVTLGSAADHTARAMFARNLFEAGGIEALSQGPLDTVEDAVSAWTASEAKVAVLCASDDLYRDQAVSVAQALKAAGLSRLYLAGKPPDDDTRTAWTQAGIDAFVFTGCPAWDLLNELQDYLGLDDLGVEMDFDDADDDDLDEGDNA